jgi:hypothetical protein
VINTQDRLSPGWWFERLLKDLEGRQARYRMLESYYDGTASVPHTTMRELKDSYRRLMHISRTNFAELVVEAVRERMNPSGFRTGASGDDNGDQDAWAIWQANTLDADSALVHRALLSLSETYVIVGPVDDDTGAPVITPEDPCEVVTAQDPVRKRKTVAALKVFHDYMASEDVAYVYLPGRVFQARRARPANSTFEFSKSFAEWDWVDDGQDLPAGVVPVVRFVNRAKLGGQGRAEFETQISILDRINYTLLNRIEIATLQAFRQRAIKGVPIKDAEGNDVDYSDIFAADPGAIWHIPDAAEIWESGEVDLGPIRSAIRDDIQDLAAVTRTPLFYLTPEATNGSAEGASLAREGLVFKTTDRLVQTGESWEQVMALAFTFANDAERSKRSDMEIMWASPERFSLAERMDAAAKAQAAGIPWRTVMEDIMQFSPQQVDRMEAEREQDLLRGAALEATAAEQVVTAQRVGEPNPTVRITENAVPPAPAAP